MLRFRSRRSIEALRTPSLNPNPGLPLSRGSLGGSSLSAECFRVDLLGSRPTDAVACLAGLESVTSTQAVHGHAFIYKDGCHVLELLVQPDRSGQALISVRFALCHPSSVDDAFVQLVARIAGELGMIIQICEDVPAGHADEFDPSAFVAFRAAVLSSIRSRRNWWIASFGSTTAALTSDEAIQRFILGD